MDLVGMFAFIFNIAKFVVVTVGRPWQIVYVGHSIIGWIWGSAQKPGENSVSAHVQMCSGRGL